MMIIVPLYLLLIKSEMEYHLRNEEIMKGKFFQICLQYHALKENIYSNIEKSSTNRHNAEVYLVVL